MFDSDWPEGCKSCSFVMDHLDPSVVHIAQRDSAFAAVSIAPYEKLAAYKERMGWHFRWVLSAGTRSNRDFHVSLTQEEVNSNTGFYNITEDFSFPVKEAPDISVFAKDDDVSVYHTYGVFSRGMEEFITACFEFLHKLAAPHDVAGLRVTLCLPKFAPGRLPKPWRRTS